MSKNQREYAHYEIISLFHREIAIKDFLRLRLEDEFPKWNKGNLISSNPERFYDIHITSRRLGQDTGRDILLDIGGQASVIKQTLYEVNKPESDSWDKTIESIDSNWTLNECF